MTFVDVVKTLWPSAKFMVDERLYQFVPHALDQDFKFFDFIIVFLICAIYQNPLELHLDFWASILLALRSLKKIEGIFGLETYGAVLMERHVP